METATGTERLQDNAEVERRSERELVVSRTVHGPARLVFQAWTDAELLMQWWAPKSFPITLLSCETDPRVGGRYRLTFGHEGSTMDFFGRYLEVTPPSRLSWTNEEGEENGPVTTVTFEESDGATLVVVHDLYPSKQALDEAIASGSTGISAMPESLAQLDELLAGMDGSAQPS
jgi:uncharacterized protein YndB with AHSA1/START domain